MAMEIAKINPDLARARAQATFDPLKLTNYLLGGPDKTRRKRFLQNLAIKEFYENGFRRECDLNREEQYEEALKKSVYAYKRLAALGLTDERERFFFQEVIFPNETSPYNLHYGMFVPTILNLGTQEQKDKWLPLANQFQFLGTYAQTEMGHGSFLRGLETTATYDPSTREFIIHSPTITATKFWPGGLGKTSNCCVVMAKLFIDGEDKGMQSFMVQIRDLNTHQPMPGIEVGDIGPKFGYGSQDNGFLRFNKVRIPRENMLMRYAKVQEDGTYIKPKNDRLVYGAMTLVRVAISSGTARALSKAVTIATRYSAVRKQSEIVGGAGEVCVLEFQTQQHKLFPHIAGSYALQAAASAMMKAYQETASQIEKGSYQQLPLLHALSSGLKAFSSWDMARGIEECRMAMGGHGYNLASGLPKIYMNEVPACTYEGENTVLCLQTARFLIKCQKAVESGVELPPMFHFLREMRKDGLRGRLDGSLELGALVEAYQYRAARLLSDASHRLNHLVSKGEKYAHAWNQSSQMLVQASLAFIHMFVVQTFAEVITSSGLDPSLTKVMTQLCQLYGAYGIGRYSGEFAKGGYLNDSQLDSVQTSLFGLLATIKPNAVALVDAFDFPDRVLDSDLGRYDGNVYESLMAYAKNSKLNKTQVHEGYFKYQKPFVDSMRLPGTVPPAKL